MKGYYYSWEFGESAKGPPLNILTLLPRTKLHLQKYHSHSYTQHGALPRKGNVWKIIFFFIKRAMGTKQTREWSIKIILCVVLYYCVQKTVEIHNHMLIRKNFCWSAPRLRSTTPDFLFLLTRIKFWEHCLQTLQTQKSK